VASYLTTTTFKTLTVMPGAFVDAIEAVSPGWTQAQLDSESARIDARLGKRYAVPFAAPTPVVVQGWLAKIVTVSAYMKRGFDPSDVQGVEYVKQRDEAVAEIKEAADSNTGLFDLPLRADTNQTGISRGFPRAYSEASPYVWSDQQGDRGPLEDSGRSGSTT
jgi:hypothetical protein